MGFWKIIKEIFWPISRSDLDDYYEESFRLWAFGNKRKLTNAEALKCWNALHGDLITYSSSLVILTNDDIAKMKNIYDDHLQKISDEEKKQKESEK